MAAEIVLIYANTQYRQTGFSLFNYSTVVLSVNEIKFSNKFQRELSNAI